MDSYLHKGFLKGARGTNEVVAAGGNRHCTDWGQKYE